MSLPQRRGRSPVATHVRTGGRGQGTALLWGQPAVAVPGGFVPTRGSSFGAKPGGLGIPLGVTQPLLDLPQVGDNEGQPWGRG